MGLSFPRDLFVAVYPVGMNRWATVVVGAAAVTGGCADPALGVRLVFPSEQTFLVSSVATIDVYDGEGKGETSADAICRALSVESSEPPAGLNTLASTGKRNVCEMRDGKIALDAVGVGRRVLFAEVQSGNTAALRGCTVVDLYEDPALTPGPRKDPPTADPDADAIGVRRIIDVPLATLPTYPTDVNVLCTDVADKCEEQTACTD
jgi:hypothetical protein